MTRKFLKELGIESELIDKIIEEHRGTVDSLKDSLDNAKAEVDKYKDIEKELDSLKEEMKGKDSYKEKYDKVKKEFDSYKAGIDNEKKESAKIEAYKAVLKESGVSEKRIESVVRLAKADGYVEKIDFDGEKISNLKEVRDAIKEAYGDYIETKIQDGADVANPPSKDNGGGKMTRADIYAKDEKGRYKLTAEERQKAIAENIGEFTPNSND